jgi:RNA polymerase sigma-70 factor (ECF subfamily)
MILSHEVGKVSCAGDPIRLSIDPNARGGVAVGTKMDVLSNADLFSGNRIHVVSERKLVVEAKRGKKAALEFLCESSAPKILRVLYRITKNREDAEDALQDSFLRALIHLKDFDGRSRFSTWLTRIAINSALMNRRKSRRDREVHENDPDKQGGERLMSQIADHSPNPEQIYAKREEGMILKNAVKALRPRIRTAVLFHLLRELSM